MEKELYLQTKAAVEELGSKANLKPGNILVVGCSTSEVLGAKIGSQSSPEVAKALFTIPMVQNTRVNGAKACARAMV